MSIGNLPRRSWGPRRPRRAGDGRSRDGSAGDGSAGNRRADGGSPLAPRHLALLLDVVGDGPRDDVHVLGHLAEAAAVPALGLLDVGEVQEELAQRKA